MVFGTDGPVLDSGVGTTEDGDTTEESNTGEVGAMTEDDDWVGGVEAVED